MMNPSWGAGAMALGGTLLLTPLVQCVCIRLRLYDLPGPLKIHSRPIPRLGGIALAIALALGFSFANHLASFSAWPLSISFALIWLTGLADDLRGLSPWIRLVAQITSATILWHEGWQVALIGGIISWLATCLLVIVFVNALNFLDGADGLAAGTVGIIAAGYVALPTGTLSHVGAGLAWSLLGAALGFLAVNFPPAKLFLGDSGSTILGFSLAFLALDSFRAGASANSLLLFPIIFAALPLLDAGLAVLRRLRTGDSPLSGDRSHFYDLLLARGWSQRKIALVCYSITAALIVAGWLSMRVAFGQKVIITATCFGALLAAALRLGSLSSCPADLKDQRKKLGVLSKNARPSVGVFPFARS